MSPAELEEVVQIFADLKDAVRNGTVSADPASHEYTAKALASIKRADAWEAQKRAAIVASRKAAS